MCGCKFKLGQSKDLNGQYPVVLAASAVSANRTKEVFLCLYHTSKEKFNQAFKDIVGDVKTESDVIALASAHDEKKDIQSFNKNFMNIARSIKFDQAELDNASCTIALALDK